MQKAEFVDEVARRAGIAKREAEQAVNVFLETVTDTLSAGGEVAFIGFGKFSSAHRAAREGNNPRDPGGEKIHIPAARMPKFSAGAHLKQAVREG